MATTSKLTRFLLDTHVWLWMNGDPKRLNEGARAILTDPTHDLFLSTVSSWEIAIKEAAGKLQLPLPAATYIQERTQTNRVRDLPIRREHALHAGALPLHHRDPFDRMLVAQAVIEKLPLLTADRQLEPYGVELIWVS